MDRRGTVKHGNEFHDDTERSFFISTIVNHGGDDSKSLGIALDPNSDEKINYICVLPSGYVSLVSLSVIFAASTDVVAGNWVLDVTSQYGGIAEQYNHHEVGDTGNIIAVAANDQYNNRLYELDDIIPDASSNDIIGFWLQRDANHVSDTVACDILVRGILMKYMAEV